MLTTFVGNVMTNENRFTITVFLLHSFSCSPHVHSKLETIHYFQRQQQQQSTRNYAHRIIVFYSQNGIRNAFVTATRWKPYKQKGDE